MKVKDTLLNQSLCFKSRKSALTLSLHLLSFRLIIDYLFAPHRKRRAFAPPIVPSRSNFYSIIFKSSYNFKVMSSFSKLTATLLSNDLGF